VDPHAVLGLEPGASPDDVHRAYRALAKRFHPDRTVGRSDGELMISINAAYDLLRDELADGAPAGRERPAAAERAAAPDDLSAARAGWGDWLQPAVRLVLARELLASLERDEQVQEVLLTATSDSHDVQLAVTDRRLIWLRDDAIVGRIRYLRFRDLRSAEGRAPGRLGRSAELRVRGHDGRRMRFFGLAPEVIERVLAGIASHTARRLV
jgi:hypothetical protein